jgi:WD40 repeat protein
MPGNLTKANSWGSWLPDSSGFVYLNGTRDGTSMNVCIWDLAKQTTTRCLLEGVDYYMQAVWSPGDTNLVAYRRFDIAREKEFVTIASAQSGKVLYESEQSLSPSGNEERFLAWHPDGKRMLLAVDDEHEQTAMIVDVESLSKIPLAQFDGDQEYIARGLWINHGQDVVLGTIDPMLCCTGEGRPDAQHVYRVHGDSKKISRLVNDINIGTILVDRDQRRLLLDTYSNGNDPSPAYWLDLDSGKLTRVFSDEFEKRGPWLLGLTPDGRYITVCDGQYQTWIFDTQTELNNQFPMEIYDTIHWRP